MVDYQRPTKWSGPMMKSFLVLSAALFSACGGGATEDSGSAEKEAILVNSEDLSSRVAAEVCSRLEDCCAEEDYEWFMGAYTADERNEDLVAKLGEDPVWNQETCASFLAPALENTWIGSWTTALDEGLVEYRQEEVAQCIENLREAECGASLRETLLDSQCFGYYPPSGGENQRTIFQRSAEAGEVCTPIADGFGGLYYGSCNPESAFCCVETEYGCDPFPTEEERGSCITASQIGEECNSMPLQLCVTGAECVEGTCTTLSYEELDVGASCCNSQTYELLGYCKDSWCDMFGSEACEPMREAGESCAADWECGTNWCDLDAEICIEHPICIADNG